MALATEIKIVEGLLADLQARGQQHEAAALRTVLTFATSVMVEVRPRSEPREHLTTGRVADMLGVSRQTIKNWVAAGRVPGVQLGGRTLIHRDDVMRLLDSMPRGESMTAQDVEAQAEKTRRRHEEIMAELDQAKLRRLQELQDHVEEGRRLTRTERSELIALERELNRAASDALARRIAAFAEPPPG